MAIWAIANIVRTMSTPEQTSTPEEASAVRDEISAHARPLSLPHRNNDDGGPDQAPRTNDFDKPKDPNPKPPEPMQLPTAREETNADTNSDPIESDFLFEEIAVHETTRAFGNRAKTETLEIELGTANMPCDVANQLQGGAVVALEQTVDDAVVIRNRDQIVATGKMTVVNGKIAVRISERTD